MAALGPLRGALQSGAIAGFLILATIPSGAWAAGPPDAGTDPEEVVAGQGNDLFAAPTPDAVREIILSTLSPADLASLVGDAARGAAVASDARVRALGAELDLRQEALARMLEILGRHNVPPERLADALAEMVARHQAVLARVRLLEAEDARAAELRDALAGALETAQYDRFDQLLAEGQAMGLEAARRLLEALDQNALQVAAIYPEAGRGRSFGFGPAGHGALLHGVRRLILARAAQFFSASGFCQWHPQSSLCQRWADSAPLCDRLPRHPVCVERFCNENRSHPLCGDDPTSSDS